jgi:tetratricopeptide (TPR) repeat protein
MDLRIPAAALLLALGGWLASEAEARRATPRPAAGASALLGGFSALAAQVVWIKADRAILERDEDRAVLLLRTLVDLEPQVVSAAQHAAQEIGWNMLQGRPDPATRWSLAREALRILSDCVAQNPGSAQALVNRGRYLSLKVAQDEGLAERFVREDDRRGPLAAARADYERALAIAPDDSDAAAGLALSAGLLGRTAARDGAWAEAADALRAAVKGYELVLADARAQFGADARDGSPEAEALRSTEDARGAAAALLDAVTADASSRPARLAEFERAHPGVLR